MPAPSSASRPSPPRAAPAAPGAPTRPRGRRAAGGACCTPLPTRLSSTCRRRAASPGSGTARRRARRTARSAAAEGRGLFADVARHGGQVDRARSRSAPPAARRAGRAVSRSPTSRVIRPTSRCAEGAHLGGGASPPGRRPAPGRRSPGRPPSGGQRRPQLVRGVGDERPLGGEGRLEPGGHLVEGAGQLGHLVFAGGHRGAGRQVAPGEAPADPGQVPQRAQPQAHQGDPPARASPTAVAKAIVRTTVRPRSTAACPVGGHGDLHRARRGAAGAGRHGQRGDAHRQVPQPGDGGDRLPPGGAPGDGGLPRRRRRGPPPASPPASGPRPARRESRITTHTSGASGAATAAVAARSKDVPPARASPTSCDVRSVSARSRSTTTCSAWRPTAATIAQPRSASSPASTAAFHSARRRLRLSRSHRPRPAARRPRRWPFRGLKSSVAVPAVPAGCQSSRSAYPTPRTVRIRRGRCGRRACRAGSRRTPRRCCRRRRSRTPRRARGSSTSGRPAAAAP